MSEYTKNRRQNLRRYETGNGDVSDTFCGRVFMAIRTMVHEGNNKFR